MKKSELAQLILTLIGILSAFASFLSMQSPYKEIFTYICAAFLLFGVLLFLNNYFGLVHSVRNLRAFKVLGITKIYTRGNTHVISDYAKTKTLKIIALSAINLIRNEKENLIKLLVDNCATIKILIADESNSAVEQIGDLISEEHKKLIKSDIASAEQLLEEYYKEAKKEAKGNQIGKIYLGKYDTHYKVPIIIFDDNYGLVTVKLPPKKSIHSVTLFLTDVDKGLLQDCIVHFDRIWEYVEKQKKIKEVSQEGNYYYS